MTITVTPTTEPDNYPPRVRLDVVNSGTPSYTETTVLRVDSTGRTSPVRTPTGDPLTLTVSGSDRVGLVYDYEVPSNAGVFYTTLEDSATVSGQVVIADTRVWLVHPGVPELSQVVTVAEFGPRTYGGERGLFRPMGRKSAIAHTTGQRGDAEYVLTLRTDTLVELAAIKTLCSDMADLFLNVPESLGWGVGAEYVSVGDLTENRLYDYAGEVRRYWDLPCTVVDRPAGGTQADRTYADLLTYATYASLQAAYSTYQDLLSGP